jgi:hypothetical protein
MIQMRSPSFRAGISPRTTARRIVSWSTPIAAAASEIR